MARPAFAWAPRAERGALERQRSTVVSVWASAPVGSARTFPRLCSRRGSVGVRAASKPPQSALTTADFGRFWAPGPRGTAPSSGAPRSSPASERRRERGRMQGRALCTERSRILETGRARGGCARYVFNTGGHATPEQGAVSARAVCPSGAGGCVPDTACLPHTSARE